MRRDGFLPIETYAAIGDGRTLALVGGDGSIDWMCLPHLDSPSLFARVLDPGRGGRFELAPTVPYATTRRYLERTNILETTFTTDVGQVRLLDALTIDKSQTTPWRELVRRVEALNGTVPLRWRCEPRFGYGQRAARFESRGETLLARDRGLQVGLRSWDAGEPEVGDGAVTGEFSVMPGRPATVALLATDEEPLPLPERENVERRLQETAEVWRAWVARHTYDGPWRDGVERSLLAIRLLADGRRGAIAAAGTTSLPEVIGGARNYDYRFGWVRDLCFTLDALLAVGMDQIVQAAVTWLLSATRHTHPRIDPVYALGGDVVRSQSKLPLPGYQATSPVHVGNNAGSQLQLGGFGDLIETIAIYVRQGHILPLSVGERLSDAGNLLARIWRSEDAGFWELGDRAHYGTSKLGSWVAFDRLLQLAAHGDVPARQVSRWRRERDEVQRFIDRHLYAPERNTYLFKAGSEQLDCAMLLAARRGFGERSRISGTIDAVHSELHAGGPLFYRYSGMQDEENAFLACSFWMVEALAIDGRPAEAAELMDAMMGLAGEVGLYSEEMEPGSRAMRGNMPQALTHLALISAAHTLASADGRARETMSSGVRRAR
jgi:GH15 family glucan-1,4-alpha-glucosidase